MEQFRSYIIIPLLWLIGMSGCDSGISIVSSNKEEPESISILTWNVQALFDGVESGYEYDEYLNSAGWSQEKYAGRLSTLAQAIGAIEPEAPDILALEEVENAGVMEVLAAGQLAKYGYNWTFFVNNSGSSLGVGVLSRVPLIKTRAHSLNINGEITPRPMMEIWVHRGGEPLALFVCHWKSKLGGGDFTESMRRASARILLRRMREIKREYPGVPIAVMGDLNENYDEFYRRNGSVVSALLPDDPWAAELTGLYGKGKEPETPADVIEKLQADFLVLSRTKPPVTVYFPQGVTILYSPWGQEMESGSYYYQNEWETIDHFLLSESFFDGWGWEFDSSYVVKQLPFTNVKGIPNSYNPRTGSGLSDHFPLILTLKWKEDFREKSGK
jgi:endonuclease/exonuclease/phosphatase family metal-dependent hydrolase